MKHLSKNGFQTLQRVCLLTLFFFAVSSANAQITAIASSKSKDADLDLYSDVTLEYSDNVFRLTESQQSILKERTIEDMNSGRFENMDSISDYILSPTIGMKYDTDSPFGGELGLTSWIKYNYYMENPESSFPEARIRMKNSIGKNGALIIEGNFLFDFFKKNYLSGYNDINDNGNVPRDERFYSQAIYNEYEGILAYDHELLKNKDNTLSQVNLRPFFGIKNRTYNSPFGNRDKNIAFGGVKVVFEFISRIDLGLTYQYENVSSPDENELVLFDETRFQLDVNEDGEIKANAPLMTHIDRSANRHTIGINPSFKLSKETRLFLGYEKRTSEYTSENPLDIDHFDQTAYRQRLKAGIRHDFSKKWSAEIEYSRIDDNDEEDGDFIDNKFAFSIKYKLN